METVRSLVSARLPHTDAKFCLDSPFKANPAYKGKWYAPMIDNPAYKGEWAPRKISNPSYFEDVEPVKHLNKIVRSLVDSVPRSCAYCAFMYRVVSVLNYGP